jgi:hypothetical protein
MDIFAIGKLDEGHIRKQIPASKRRASKRSSIAPGATIPPCRLASRQSIQALWSRIEPGPGGVRLMGLDGYPAPRSPAVPCENPAVPRGGVFYWIENGWSGRKVSSLGPHDGPVILCR